MKLFKSKNDKPEPFQGNKQLTEEQKAARIQAELLAQETAQAAMLEAAEKAKRAREKSGISPTQSNTQSRKQRVETNSTGKIFKDIISGKFLTSDGITSHIPYLLFMTCLFLAYISLGYKFENIEREKMRTERALEEVVSEYKTLRSELESRLQQSRVESAISELGLEQPKSPPILLKVNAE